jgi:hypothetical protein
MENKSKPYLVNFEVWELFIKFLMLVYGVKSETIKEFENKLFEGEVEK